MEDGMVMLNFPDPHNFNQLKSGLCGLLCPNSMLNSPLLKPFTNMHVPLAKKFPNFAVQGDTALEMILGVLAASKILSSSLAWLYLS